MANSEYPSTGQPQGPGQNPYDNNQAEWEQPKKDKKKSGAGKKIVVFLIWVAVIALLIFTTLFLASKIGQFESIGDMLTYIRGWIG